MTEALVAMPVERESLEEPVDVEDPRAPPREHFHAGVEPLNKPTRLPTLAVVRELIHPPLDRPAKAVELRKSAGTHALDPGLHRTLSPRLRVVALEECCQVFSQVVGRVDLRRVGKHPLEQRPCVRLELPRPLTKRPQRPLERGVLGLGPRSLEPLESCLRTVSAPSREARATGKRSMTISAPGTSSSIALTKPSSIAVQAHSIVCRSGSGIARRKAATVSCWRSASTARISTPPPRAARSPARRHGGAHGCVQSCRCRSSPATPKRSSSRRAQSSGRGCRQSSPPSPRACGPYPRRSSGSTCARPMARTPSGWGGVARTTRTVASSSGGPCSTGIDTVGVESPRRWPRRPRAYGEDARPHPAHAGREGPDHSDGTVSLQWGSRRG